MRQQENNERNDNVIPSDKVCIRCTKPASVEKILMLVSKYISMADREQIAEEWHSTKSFVYLCYSCAECEFSH